MQARLHALVLVVAVSWAISSAFAQVGTACKGVWSAIPPSVPGPAAREAHSLVWVGAPINRVFMFGGSNFAGTFYNDLWSFDGTRWVAENTGGPPGPFLPAGRRKATVVVLPDPNRNNQPTIVVYGGAIASGIAFDLWSWSRSTGWIRYNDTGISLWNAASTTLSDGTAVVTGGATTDCGQISDRGYRIVWTGLQPQLVELGGSPSPGLRRWGLDGTAGFTNQSMLTAGGDSSCTFGPGLTSHYSIATGGLNPIGAPDWFISRNNAALSTASNPNLTQIISFGGNELPFPAGISNTMQVSDGGNWLNFTGPRPSARLVSGAVEYDPVRRYHVLFGGLGPNNQVLGDTWVYMYQPLITAQPPATLNVTRGETLAITVGVLASTSSIYAWSRDETPLNSIANPWGSQVQILGSTLLITNAQCADSGIYRLEIDPACPLANNVAATITHVSIAGPSGCCDSVDFNNNGVFPEDNDILDLFFVLSGGNCTTCNDIDFNNNGVFPEDQDILDFFNVLAGGGC
jgi:hypothetical protein